MRQGWKLMMMTAPALLLLAAGCATRGYVRDVVDKQGYVVDERFGRVEARVTEESTRLTQTSQRADAAHARADEVNSRVTRLWNNRHVRNHVETVDVQFAFDRADLNDGAQTMLVSLVKELKENPQLTVDLEGYTDPRGPRDYNYQLSQRRVESVRRFLVEQGVELPRIHSIGRGPLNDRAMSNDKKRRVTLRLMVAQD